MARRAGEARPAHGSIPGDPRFVTRVVVANHSDVIRRGLTAILAEASAVTVVGCAETLRDAIEQARELRPDVVVLDGAFGPDAFAAVRALSVDSGASVVIVAAGSDAQEALDAFAAGARGFLTSDSRPDELVTAIERARRGETSVDPILGARLLQALATRPRAAMTTPDPLTPRERDVLRLLASGRTNM